MSVFSNFFKKSKNEDASKDVAVKSSEVSYQNTPFLRAIKPYESYVFHSDYFQVDDGYGTIMSFFHKEASNDSFAPFWGINRLPSGLGDDVVTICLEQTHRMTENWIVEHQNVAEGISRMNETEQSKAGSLTTKGKAVRDAEDLQVIAREIQDGASYLHVQYRLLVKAKSLESLDDAVSKIERLYIDRFSTLSVAVYPGDQRREMATLFSRNGSKKGAGYYFTSTELAGSYSLVTNGFNDDDGEYIGYMTGDVNNAAVLFDIDDYDHHVVVSNEDYNEILGRVHISDMWGSKISQSCLLNSGRVVHIILDDANLYKLGPKMASITSVIDMNTGDVNMFEIFGDQKDELSLFPIQMRKLAVMTEQFCDTGDADRALIRGSLEDIALKFYKDKGMWYDNASENRDKLRIVGIPHKEVPRLQMFLSYLQSEHKRLVSGGSNDREFIHAINVLLVTFKSLLANNGDLFNNITSNRIDAIRNRPRVVYDFSKLFQRGERIAMAQLVNIIGFAISNLDRGDTVIIHGSDLISDDIKPYIRDQMQLLYNKGGRVAFIYNNTDKMLDDVKFNEFDKADYTIFGNMTSSSVDRYQKILGRQMPPGLVSNLTNKVIGTGYIRRGFDNVLFMMDISLGFKNKKKGK